MGKRAVIGATLAVPRGQLSYRSRPRPPHPLGQGSLRQGSFPLLNQVRMRALC